jgi:ribosomal protein S18 acetylase RimI-like enzyme
MFQGMHSDIANNEWIESAAASLIRHLPLATIIGAVMDRVSEPGLCASGLLQIQEGLGSPRFPKGAVGHISSVAVDPEWRRKGIGERVLRFLVDEARNLGLERVDLHATPDGEGIYRRLGFHDRQGVVDLRLEL